MRPRWVVALLLFTFPIWFLPAVFWVGWKECGMATLEEFPSWVRYVFLGKRP